MWTQIILIFSMVVLVKPIRNGHQRPNIIYILADDMGWNDVSFHGSDQIPTPNIDALAYSGVILNRHYVQPLCTPSRAALMTGKYPINIGIHDALAPSHRVGLPLNIKILPQYLKEIGYKNHLVGKWHLGFHQKQYTPLQRGFDSHFGYWTGALSYYDHIDQDPIVKKYSGHDMRRNYTTAWDVQGQYATDLFTDEAVRLIENHCPDSPIFLYLAHLATHAGNEGKLLEAPQEEIEKFWYISDPNRRSYAAMVSILDKSVGAVVDALDRKGILENSIIVFLSDNGAPNIGDYANWGSNYPWRGQKKSLWEGAVRTPSLIWSPLIHRPSRVSHDLMHMTDWLPTLLSVAGYNIDGLDIDGVNQWTTISKSKPSVRDNLVVDINPETNMHSVIFGQYKFIQGPSPSNAPAEVNKFLNLDTIISPRQPAYDIENILKSPAWRAVEKYSNDPHLPYKIRYIRDDAAVRRCIPDNSYVINCTYKPCLFNLKNDPCEKIDVAESYPTFLKEIVELIDHFVLNGSPNLKIESDPASNPIYFNDTWSTWEDDCGRPLIYLGPD